MREWRSSVMSPHLKEEGLWKITAITVLSDHNHPKMKISYCAGSSLFRMLKTPSIGHEGSANGLMSWKWSLAHLNPKNTQEDFTHEQRASAEFQKRRESVQDELKLFCLHLSFPNTKKYKFSSLLCTASSLRGWSKRTQINEFKVKQITAGGVSSACEPLSSTPQIQEQKG